MMCYITFIIISTTIIPNTSRKGKLCVATKFCTILEGLQVPVSQQERALV